MNLYWTYYPSQHQDTSVGNSPISAPPKHSQKREGNGKLIRSILLNNETHQAQTPSPVQPQQKTSTSNSENLKRLPRPPNVRSAVNGHVSHKEIEGDRSKDVDDKFAKKDVHNMSNISEKQEKRTRNKDRPDRGVWAPLRRADVSNTSDERISSSPSLAQPTQQLIDPAEGTLRFEIMGLKLMSPLYFLRSFNLSNCFACFRLSEKFWTPWNNPYRKGRGYPKCK